MSLRKNLNISFITPYPKGTAPGQRFRFEQYLDLLELEGHQIDFFSFLSNRGYDVLYTKGNSPQKILFVLKGFLKRIYQLLLLFKVDYIFLYREATPIGPPIFEWVIARILQKKIIYDFDDAIWLTDRKLESKFLKIIKGRRKVKHICSWSYKVSCGNQYLVDFALKYNSQVILNPTTIDCLKVHSLKTYESKRNIDRVVIGWTGSHSTLKYLQWLEPVLKIIEDKFQQVSFLVIADRVPMLKLNRLEFINWKASTEILGLIKMDIGIMPLPDDEWTKGKCGFKALQYMSLKIPTVASPVGVNTQIINHGVNGFLASSFDGWMMYLEKLILNEKLRREIGKSGRETVISSYSVASNSANFLSLFE